MISWHNFELKLRLISHGFAKTVKALYTINIKESKGRIHKTPFSSKLTNGNNKLECYITLSWKGHAGTNTLASLPFVSYEENIVL